MKRIAIASVFLMVIVVLTVGIVLYGSGVFVPTGQLRTDGFKQLSFPNNETSEARFYNNKIEVAIVDAGAGLVGEPMQNLAGMRFYVSHETGVLDSLYLEFTPMNPGAFIEVYLERSSSQIWPPMIFQTSTDGSSTVMGVSDLGLLGIGTIGLNFYLEPSGTTGFWFEANFTMHTAGFPPTHEAGSAQIGLPFTFATTTQNG